MEQPFICLDPECPFSALTPMTVLAHIDAEHPELKAKIDEMLREDFE